MVKRKRKMQGFRNVLFVTLGFVVGCSALFSTVSFDNNAYNGILVAINPDVPEDPAIVETIKGMITNASNVLFAATHQRAYFGNVTILVPKTWNESYDMAQTQSYSLADVIVADANPVYGDSPYTVQYGQCGMPGSYIHFTPDYLTNNTFVDDFGPRGKAFVHEWAHLRWGVYDETPTYDYNHFYYDRQNNQQATRCPLGLKGENFYFPPNDPNNYRVCRDDPNTGLPEAGCVFVPHSETPVNASLMSHQFIEEIVEFCDDQVEDNPQVINHHNNEAPNEQNRLCDLRSVWSVIRSSVDFNNNNLPNSNIVDITPSFQVLKAKTFEKFVLVLDVSGSMNGERLEDMQKAASLFVNKFLPNGTKVGIVQFNIDSNILHDLDFVDEIRQDLVDIITNLVAGGSTCIGCGISDGLIVLEQDSQSAAGGHLLVLSDGGENAPPFVTDITDVVLSKGAIVDSIFFGISTANQALQKLTEESQGVWFFNDDLDSGALLETFKELAYLQDGDVYKEVFQLYGETFELNQYDQKNGTVFIDSTIGNQTVFTFSYSAVKGTSVVLHSPDGSRYCTSDDGNCAGLATVDTNLKTFMFSIAGTATVGSWLFEIQTSDYTDKVDVIVTSMAANRDIVPMIVEAAMSDNDLSNQEPVVVYAKVAVGYTPILGADVIATITSPSSTSYTLTLLDSGSAPDVRRFDGVYSRYFTEFYEVGRYSIKVKVTGLGNQTSTTGGTFKFSSAAYNPGTVESNGTIVLNPKGPVYNGDTSGIETSELDPFARVVSPGGISYSGTPICPSVDTMPPGKVIDLQAEQVDVTDLSRGVRLTFSAPGDNYDSGTASTYEIRYTYNNSKELIDNFVICLLVNESAVLEGTVSAPKVAGSQETVVANLSNVPEELDAISVWFAMRAHDAASHVSPTSNVAMMNVFIVPFISETTTATTDEPSSTADVSTNGDTSTITTECKPDVSTANNVVVTPASYSEVEKQLQTFQLVTIVLVVICSVQACALVAAVIMRRKLHTQYKVYKKSNDMEMNSSPKTSVAENHYRISSISGDKSAQSNGGYEN